MRDQNPVAPVADEVFDVAVEFVSLGPQDGRLEIIPPVLVGLFGIAEAEGLEVLEEAGVGLVVAVEKDQPFVFLPAEFRIDESHAEGMGDLGKGLAALEAPGVARSEVLSRSGLGDVAHDGVEAVPKMERSPAPRRDIVQDLEAGAVEVDDGVEPAAFRFAVFGPGGQRLDVQPLASDCPASRGGARKRVGEGPGGIAGRPFNPRLPIPDGQDRFGDAVESIQSAGELLRGLDPQGK